MSVELNRVPLTDLATAINRAHEAATTAARSALERGREAGELLQQAKAQVPHGAWLPWLADQCPTIAPRTAQAYMRVARCWSQLAAKCATGAHLPVRQALALLASPHAPIEDPDEAAEDAALAEMNGELRLLARMLDAPDLSIEDLTVIIRRAEEVEGRAHAIRVEALAGYGRCVNELETLVGADGVKVFLADPMTFRQACEARIAELGATASPK